jgi:hypothetical protein
MTEFLSTNFSSHLKEGERVCGGRGQFGKEPLWNSNAFSKLRTKLIKGGLFNLMSWRHSRKLRCPVLSHGQPPENAGKAVKAATEHTESAGAGASVEFAAT